MHFSGRNHIVVRDFLLQHHPHHLHVVLRIPPVAPRIDVAHVEAFLQSAVNPRHRHRDLARHEGLAPPRRLVVEQYPIAGVKVVRFPVILRDPEAVLLCNRVRTARIERRRLALRNLLHLAVEFGGRCLVKPRRNPGLLDRVQQPQSPDRIGLRRVLRNLETHLHVALRAEVVDFGGLDLLDQAAQVRRIGQVSVVQEQPYSVQMRIAVQMVDPPRVEAARTPDDAVHLVALLQQQLGQIGTILTRYARNQCSFHVFTPQSHFRPDCAAARSRIRASRQYNMQTAAVQPPSAEAPF